MNLDISVKTIHTGQSGAYSDSEYIYEIDAKGCGESFVKDFCTKVLNPCSQTLTEWNKNSSNMAKYFYGFYVFSKISKNKYRYYKRLPFTG